MNAEPAVPRRTLIFWYALLALVIGFAAVTVWLQIQYRKLKTPVVLHHSATPDETLRTFSAVPDFQLTERSGKTITRADLMGKVWLADFIYTTCPGPCPLLTKTMADMQATVLKNDDVRFVSISIDPESDTPEVLRKYADGVQASPDKWLFLTGENEAVKNLVNHGFILAAEDRVAAMEPLVHSTYFALVDKRGMIRGYYEGTTDENNARLVRDIKRLAAE